MKTIKFTELARQVAARKARLEAAGEIPKTEALRNKGLNRTAAKRALLDRAEARARP